VKFNLVSIKGITSLFPEFLPDKDSNRGKLTKFVEAVNATLYAPRANTLKEVYAICDRDM